MASRSVSQVVISQVLLVALGAEGYCQPEKMQNVRVASLVLFGASENYSSGYISDSSERLPQRGGGQAGKVSMYVILMKGKCMQSSTCLFAEGSASHKEQELL